MKALLFFFLIISTSAANSQSPIEKTQALKKNETKTSDKQERNKRIVLEGINALVKGDIDAVVKDWSPDIVNYGNGNVAPVRGIENVKRVLLMVKAAIPIDKWELYQAVAEGDWVMVWGRWYGHWNGDWMGQKATGKPYAKRDVEIFKFSEEGKLIEHHSVQSLLDIASQVGMKIPESKPAADGNK